jgi:long-chain fatty acid transport protein
MNQATSNLRALPALLLALFSGTSLAAGFALQNQNGAGTGNAYAGAAAAAEDASTIFFNPAGMTYLPQGHSVTLAGTILDTHPKFNNEGSTGVTGGNGGNAGGISFVPAAYYSYAISPALRLGVGLSAPFGSKTEYDDNYIGRYWGLSSDIKSINLNPSVAFKVNDMISLGLGVNVMKFEAELKTVARRSAVNPALSDSLNTIEGDDIGWGYNLGAMFQLSPSTRIGVAYRSKVDIELEGNSTFSPEGFPIIAATPQLLAQTTALNTGLSNRAVRADIELPDSFSLAVHQKLSDKWEMLGDFTWTGWSSIGLLEIKATSGNAAQTQRENLNFEDSWRIGLGANYQYSPELKLRMGVAYDKTPVQDGTRLFRLPDQDRTWLAFGAKWQFNKQGSLDIGYAHLFVKDAKIELNPLDPASNPAGAANPILANRGTMRGTVENNINILSAQLNYSF